MKVRIGPYKSWIGPHQIAKFFFGKFLHEDKVDKIGSWLGDTWIYPVCQWVEKKRTRNIKVRIDDYDVWSADHTLALIILPTLKKLKEQKHGSCMVDDVDVPYELRSTTSPEDDPANPPEYGCDGNVHKRWDWVMDEMIFAFEHVVNDDWEDQFSKGNFDIVWEKVEGTELSEMKTGPNDTYEFDKEGYTKYNDRIQNGLILFGKYYRGLWD